ncbi:ABC transporter permease [Microvirga sp. W0021]|uniref:ABC transporter permease n=1 Tax=Hohaiivirga grylli TaxID=3133970 RepID=A0ABV0BKA9_9HYPH
MRSIALKISIPLIVIVATIALWAGSLTLLDIPSILLPSPAMAFSAAVELVCDGVLFEHIVVSIKRLTSGYILAVALSLPAAFMLSQSVWAKRILNPTLEFLRQIPPLAMMPLLILWLGIGEAQKVGIIILACFFPIFLGALGGIAQCDPKLKEVGRISGLNNPQILWRIVLPSALPAIVIGLRIALGQGWRALVGAELVASAAGLGYMIVDAENLARTDIIVVGIIVIGILGLTSDWVARWLIVRFAPWVKIDEGPANA